MKVHRIRKKILFIQDNLFYSPDANSRIVFRLIQFLLEQYDCDISLLGRAAYAEELVDEYRGCKLIHDPQRNFEQTRRLKENLGKLHLLRYMIMPRTISYRIHSEEEPYVVEARRWLKKHASEYDVVVATCSPYYPLKLAAEISKIVPVIYYKIDPVSTAPLPNTLNKDTKLVTIENEIAWDTCASRIITTDVIFKYYNQLHTKVNADKVLLLNYPNIIERKLSNMANNSIIDSFDKTKINLCFIGTFYSDIRNPQYLLDLMDKLSNTNIVLHVLGRLGDCAAMIDAYRSSHCNLIYHGVVPPTVADDIMLQADILVHVGNAEDAYMPSKILDYISSGKPILNLCKIPTCPTIPLMERYPLGITIYEYEDLTNEILSQVEAFCRDNKCKQLAFDTISKLYYDSTIEYVGEQFYRVIESVTTNN